MREPLIPTASISMSVIPNAYYASGEGFSGFHGSADSDCLIVQAALVQQQPPGLQAIAENESRKIVDQILSGQKDGERILRTEHKGFICSELEGSEMSSGIRNAIKSSVHVDNLDPLFLQQRNDPVGTSQNSKEETAQYSAPLEGYLMSGTQGYKMSEYKSIYDSAGSSSDGYKVGEYKSVYDV